MAGGHESGSPLPAPTPWVMGQCGLSSLIRPCPLSCLSFWGPLTSGHRCWFPSMFSKTPGQLLALCEDACSVTTLLCGFGSQVPGAQVLTLERRSRPFSPPAPATLTSRLSLQHPKLLWTSGKEPACQCRRLKRCGFGPWVGRSPGEGPGDSLQYSCLKNPWTEEPDGLQSMGLQRVRHD